MTEASWRETLFLVGISKREPFLPWQLLQGKFAALNIPEQNLISRSQTPLNPEATTFRDVYEILRVPILLAAIAIAGTWVVWYFTHTSCSEELARVNGCNPSVIAGYINLDALNKIMAHAVIAGGGGGLWSYAMTTRQRKIIEVLEHQLAEERERASEEREKAAEERERFAAIITEELRNAAEERERAAEERRQLLALVESIREQHNCNSQAGS